MSKVKTAEEIRFNFSGVKRLAVLGIGSDLRGDDAAGIAAAGKLESSLKRCRKGTAARVFIGETAPENLTGEIKRYKPTHIVIIDSADFRKKPGSVFIFDPGSVCDGATFSTHKMPARILVDYLKRSLDCDVRIVCIQVKTVAFGAGITSAVDRAAGEVARQILKLVRNG